MGKVKIRDFELFDVFINQIIQNKNSIGMKMIDCD